MTDPEFDDFLSARLAAYEEKQQNLREQYGLGTYDRWDYDQTTERLKFSDEAGRVVVEATVIPIGTWSVQSDTWQWAWANPSMVEPGRSRAAQLRGLFEATDGLDCFHAELFDCGEAQAWELAALAVDHLGAVGCYAGPAGPTIVFLAIVDIRKNDEAGTAS
ncbi:MAG TPA: hypothetical protein VGO11_06790 [Chthoniobacteraceae bacterium]|jgi:hypothetical protein|nr:hypothetical protein [Chthoniobacteraceae bacterium]